MKILIIGGNGTIGKVVRDYYDTKHEILVGGRTNSDITIDISDSNSIHKAFKKIGLLDAIVCIAGEAKWDKFEDLTEEDYYIGIKSKLMGQVNLTRIGSKYLNKGGSITLSTGILADEPVEKTASAAMVNGAIHSFVKAVDLEIGNDVRINVVSLGLVDDAYEKYKDYFPGYNPISMNKTLNAYKRAIDGKERGKILRTYQ